MQSLERRLELLEAGSRPGACLECECARLNAVANRADAPAACSHRPGLTLMDALVGLSTMEARHAGD
jgi:hypothetical protein